MPARRSAALGVAGVRIGTDCDRDTVIYDIDDSGGPEAAGVCLCVAETYFASYFALVAALLGSELTALGRRRGRRREGERAAASCAPERRGEDGGGVTC